MRNQLQKRCESEGYRMTAFTTDAERAQVTLEWDKRCLPRCGVCKRPMRINLQKVTPPLFANEARATVAPTRARWRLRRWGRWNATFPTALASDHCIGAPHEEKRTHVF